MLSAVHRRLGDPTGLPPSVQTNSSTRGCSMDNQLKQFGAMGSEDNWRTPSFRQSVVTKIEEVIQRSGMQVARNSGDMEQHVFNKAKTREEYMNMVAKLILHVREMSQAKPNQGGPNMQGPNPNQGGPNQVQNQQQQGPGGQGMAPDPINALQNLASQGSRNQMMNMGPQGQMPQQMGPNSMGMQGQMQQNPMVSQGQPQTATNLLQTLNQRPQLNMQLQNKLGGGMGMSQMGNQQMGGGMGQMQMGGQMPMSSQLQNQLAGPMQGQMMSNMSMPGGMQGPMGGGGSMGQMGPGQMGQMGGQMAPNAMQGQMGPGQMGPGQMGPGQMGMNNSQMMSMLHMSGRGGKEVVLGGYGRAPPPSQFLRQSPSPSAPSPMQGPSPQSMGVHGGPMPSPMSSLGGMSCGAAGSPSSGQQHMHHPHQRGVGMGMVASPSSSLNTPLGGSVASPCGEEGAYREKVRQLSKYIEPLRRMVHRMVSEGENVEKLTKMKNLLDILSNPNKRVPLETLIKCEVVLEKLDFFKRSEGAAQGGPSAGKEQIFNPLLEVVNNVLQSPFANHTLKRTFGPTLDALDGPDIKNIQSPQKMPKVEETSSTIELPDVLQGEIARLDSRFKVSLDPMQLSSSTGAISLIAQIDDARLPCVPPVHVTVPREYPAVAPARMKPKQPKHDAPDSFLARVEKAMDARCARLPKSCSVGQLLDAWEMSVRQACAPSPMSYAPVPALGM